MENRKPIRVFVSSTFRDMNCERHMLNTKVFPELRARCLKRGVEFVGVDLRWGLTEEESLGGDVVDVCFKEIDACRPFFIGFMGARYGWVPPPDEVPAEDFERVMKDTDADPNFLELLAKWYQLSKRGRKPVYKFNRKEKARNPEDKSDETLTALWESNGLPGLGLSVTHREIEYGVFNAKASTPYALFYLRPLLLRWRTTDPAFSAAHFMSSFREPDKRATTKQNELRTNIVRLKGSTFKARWYNPEPELEGVRIDPQFVRDRESLSEKERQCLEDGIIQPCEWPELGERLQEDLKKHAYIVLTGMDELAAQILEDLWTAIEADLKAREQIEELNPHDAFILERTQGFVGRGNILREMIHYAKDDDSGHPLVVVGSPGSGKSAVMAKFTLDCREKFPDALVVPYFIGGVADSTSVDRMLRYIWNIVQPACGLEESPPDDSRNLRDGFKGLLKDAGEQKPVVIVLDALNQLETANRAQQLDWLPAEVPPGCKIVVSTLPGQCLERLEARDIPDELYLDLEGLIDRERRAIVDYHVKKHGKLLPPGLENELVSSKTRSDADNPLYLRVAVGELVLFGSHEDLEEKVSRLPGTLPELFDAVLERLEMDHGRDLTETVFRWLGASRSGLSEAELLGLLEKRFPNDPRASRLNWARLYRAMEPYMRPTDETGSALIYFYHDQVRYAVYRRYFDMPQKAEGILPTAEIVPIEELVPTTEYRHAHKELAEYFLSVGSHSEPLQWKEEQQRALGELVYHQIHAEDWKQAEATLCDLRFIEAKAKAGMTYGLIADYDLAKEAFPDETSQAEQAKEREHQEKVKAYVDALVAYAASRGEKPLPEPIPSVKTATAEIQAAEEHDYGPLDRIRAFANFVSAESHDLVHLAEFPHGYLVQQAINSAKTGPVVDKGEDPRATEEDSTMILLPKAQRPDYAPKPNLMRTLATEAKAVAVTADGKTAVSAGSEGVAVWDLANGQRVRLLEKEGPSCVAVTPDGRFCRGRGLRL